MSTSAIQLRDRAHRQALADLLSGGNTVDEIATRLAIKPKSVYEMAGRFDRSTQMRHAWPWRRRRHPGRKPSPFLPNQVNENSQPIHNEQV